LLPLLPLLAVAASGGFRTVLGVSLGTGLLLAAMASAPVVYLLARAARPGLGSARERLGAALFLVLALALTFFTLYNRWFEGLPSVGGGDAGQHLGLRLRFLADQPNAYYGFTGFYALTHWLEAALGLGAFESFRAVFYAVPCCLALVVAAAFLRTAEDGQRFWAGLAVLALGFAATAVFVTLPLLHYHQADGFYPHLFSLVPLFAGWVLYGAAGDKRLRLLLPPATAVYLRFTYGLNLGDLLVTAAVLWALEARGLEGRWRWAVRLGSVGLVAGAAAVYAQLLPLMASMPGGVVAHRSVQLGVVQVAMSVVLFSLPALAARLAAPLSEPGVRLARFAGLFCALGGVVPLAFHALALPIHYYLYKYGLDGVVLLTAAWAVCLAELVPSLLLQPKARAARPVAGALVAALAVGTVYLDRSFPPQWASFVERVWGTAPWKALGPLRDPAAAARIEEVLSSERRAFGGVIGSSWPLTIFLNASFGLWQDWPQFENLVLLRDEGRCWFWYAQPDPFAGFGAQVVPPRLQGRAAELEADPAARCDEYQARWSPGVTVRLCHSCR
jgi:hypothetical protein